MMIHMIELERCLFSAAIDLNMYGSLLPRKASLLISRGHRQH